MPIFYPASSIPCVPADSGGALLIAWLRGTGLSPDDCDDDGHSTSTQPAGVDCGDGRHCDKALHDHDSGHDPSGPAHRDDGGNGDEVGQFLASCFRIPLVRFFAGCEDTHCNR